MATEPIQTDELLRLINECREWLLIRGSGASFPVGAGEIEVAHDGGRARFGFLAENGFRIFGLEGWSLRGAELDVRLTSQFRMAGETIRLVPRTSAAELGREVEMARRARAAEIARDLCRAFPNLNLKRVALKGDSGRVAEAIFEENRGRVSVVADVTGALAAESLLATAIFAADRLPAADARHANGVWIAAPKKQARALQKLSALLKPRVQDNMHTVILEPTKEPPCRMLRSLTVGDLWREKPPEIMSPAAAEITATAARIRAICPESIDVVRSKQGETLRFLGLPFARVRKMLGREKAWLGIERESVPLAESGDGPARLVEELRKYRRPDSDNRRHRYFQLAPEAWLESLLVRNIKRLDPNLILSPLYNQFRASNDRIDLLALRRDGRLVIIELKTSPDRETVLQAADYWRKVELRRRRGQLAKAKLFGDLVIRDKPSLVYAVAPALSFHRDFEYFAKKLVPEIELWRFELHENWRSEIKVIGRKNYNETL